jgi:hypothetical protein
MALRLYLRHRVVGNCVDDHLPDNGHGYRREGPVKRWRPNEQIREYLTEYGHGFRGFMPVELYDMAEFYCAPWFWYRGITFNEDRILFDDDVYNSQNMYFQTLIVHHELVHVAQQKTMPQGLLGFYVTYGWEWVRSGFSYHRMKKIGIEAEAIRETDKFRGALYGGTGMDSYYSTRTNLMMLTWLEKEAKQKMKRIRV